MLAKPRNKKEVQARTTHKKILAAAAELFTRQGYHKTTIADIAQAVNLTSGAVFHHFRSKEALLDEVVSWLARGISIYSDQLNKARRGSLKVTEEVVVIMCEHFRRQPEATICLAALATEFAGSGHPMEQRLKEVYEDFVQAFSRVLSHNPQVKNARAAAMALIGAVQGIAIQGLLRAPEVSIEELAQAFLSMLADW
ncbi:MAG: TetR/AcrR family transcriptional regulator [Deltaproteobacteria bacterium]|nr:TetR/AcrR family transcriptional regulator [Deltaproteobacteria bacterium]MBW2069808.1 TetR/AcrR family transcriptional regulator [Deltaproteobacteria bacterium]